MMGVNGYSRCFVNTLFHSFLILNLCQYLLLHLVSACFVCIVHRADGLNEQCATVSDGAEGNGMSTVHDSLLSSGPGESSHDVDKQERIERYVRMTIQNQAESRLAQNSADNMVLVSLCTIQYGSSYYSNFRKPEILMVLWHPLHPPLHFIQSRQGLLLATHQPKIVC